ncbi:MAG: (2Fe-2S)-binding protein [Candidatus Omnitrophota bacterium]
MADEIVLRVNGRDYSVLAEPDRMLLSVLRDELDLTGTKYGCGEGQCGACTVLIDDSPRKSCLTKISAAAGKAVTTIEGLALKENLHPLQTAFLEADAFQCGYCAPGMIMAGVGLLKKNSHPAREEIADFMQGNICRCGTYGRIVEAIQKAAAVLEEKKG